MTGCRRWQSVHLQWLLSSSRCCYIHRRVSHRRSIAWKTVKWSTHHVLLKHFSNNHLLLMRGCCLMSRVETFTWKHQFFFSRAFLVLLTVAHWQEATGHEKLPPPPFPWSFLRRSKGERGKEILFLSEASYIYIERVGTSPSIQWFVNVEGLKHEAKRWLGQAFNRGNGLVLCVEHHHTVRGIYIYIPSYLITCSSKLSVSLLEFTSQRLWL